MTKNSPWTVGKQTWRKLWLFPGSLAAALTLYLAILGLLRPAWSVQPTGKWFVPHSGNGWFILLFVGLWGLTYVTYWWPRRRLFWRTATRDLPAWVLGIIVGLALIGGVLGYASHLACMEGSSRFFSSATWTLMLFLGESELGSTVPGEPPVCAKPYPLSFEIAQFAAIGTTAVGAVTILLALSREHLARYAARFSRDLDIVVGLNDLSLPVVRALIAESHSRWRSTDWYSKPWWDQQNRLRGRTRVVVLHPNREDPLVAEASAAGAIVVVGDVTPTVLGPMLFHGRVGKRKPSIRRLFAFSEDQGVNLATVQTAESVLVREISKSSYHADQAVVVPRMVVRLDDAREARDWRLSRVGASDWFVDALSTDDLTAEAIVDRLVGRGIERLSIYGDTPLTATLLERLVWRAWAEAELRSENKARRPWKLHEIVVIGPGADLICDEWEQRCAPSARTANAPAVSGREGDWERLARTELVLQNSALVVTETGKLPLGKATRLARLYPAALVLAIDEMVQGVHSISESECPRIGGTDDDTSGFLVRFGPTLLQRTGVPEDSWTQLARLQHTRWTQPSGELHSPEGRAARRPWNGPDDPQSNRLPDFFREDNLRQQRLILREIARHGKFNWKPSGAPNQADLSELIGVLAELEHERWCKIRESAGWGGVETENPFSKVELERRRLNVNLRDWHSARLRGRRDPRVPQGIPSAASRTEFLAGLHDSNEEVIRTLLRSLYFWGIAPVSTLPRDIPPES